MRSFLAELRTQRWDDHRYYHHSRINQTLHLISALSFLCAYVLVFKDPAMAALVGWLVAMTSRQIGHLFFEPRGYDVVNQATDEYKEAIKVGYNIRRKLVLLTIWALSPLLLLVDPTMLRSVQPSMTWTGFVRNLGYLWLALGIGGLLFRTLHLFFIRDVRTGLAWATKIITDPFHDVKLYHRAPAYLLQGELIDPSIVAEYPH
jgi:hypothetical protein